MGLCNYLKPFGRSRMTKKRGILDAKSLAQPLFLVAARRLRAALLMDTGLNAAIVWSCLIL